MTFTLIDQPTEIFSWPLLPQSTTRPASLSDRDAEYLGECLLDMKTELGGWGEVWQEYGLIGRPEEVGPPDHAGPPFEQDEDEGDSTEEGRPDEPGPPEDVGPPDHAGPKDKGRDPGPPFGVPPGQEKKGPPNGNGGD